MSQQSLGVLHPLLAPSDCWRRVARLRATQRVPSPSCSTRTICVHQLLGRQGPAAPLPAVAAMVGGPEPRWLESRPQVRKSTTMQMTTTMTNPPPDCRHCERRALPLQAHLAARHPHPPELRVERQPLPTMNSTCVRATSEDPREQAKSRTIGHDPCEDLSCTSSFERIDACVCELSNETLHQHFVGGNDFAQLACGGASQSAPSIDILRAPSPTTNQTILTRPLARALRGALVAWKPLCRAGSQSLRRAKAESAPTRPLRRTAKSVVRQAAQLHRSK